MSIKAFETPGQEVRPAELPVRGWRGRLNRDWSSWSDSRAAAYLLFAVIYIVPNLVLARQKLMWDDEFFTLYLSRTANWSDLWHALSTGADQHPPSFYYLTHLIFGLVGTTHVTLRSTALFGFALSCICLYEIAREVIGVRWGLPAMLVPLTTPALYYATEARGYGLELGFVTFSLLMWIWATEGKKRAWTVPGLAVGLCLAVASHYYALFILVPLAIGELVKFYTRRSFDFPICATFFAGLLPILLFASLIVRALPYSRTFWAVPSWGEMLAWYPSMLGRAPLILLAAAALTFLFGIPSTEGSHSFSPEASLPVGIMLTTTALLPVPGVIVAMLLTHAFTARYFIGALPGAAIFVVWALRRITRNNRVGPALTVALCVVLFGQQWRDQRAAQVAALRVTRSIAAVLRRAPDSPVSPIAIVDVTNFHRLSFYAQRDLASRLVYLADPHLSVRYLGQDTIDRGLLALNPWFPLKTVWWYEWWRDHPSSLVYGSVGEWNWITFALREVGTAELANRDTWQILFKVSRTTVPNDDRLRDDPPGKPMLYDQLPVSGPSLCSIYMPNDECPVVDNPKFSPIISYRDLLK